MIKVNLYISLGNVPLASLLAIEIAVEMKAEKLVVPITIFYPCRNNYILTLLIFTL